MTRSATKPPTTQRRFLSAWSELEYVCSKIHYWLYTRKHQAKAARYVNRLERLLGELPENDLAIIREEGLALLNELKCDIVAAIVHREREIQLTERLHHEAKTHDDRTRGYMLQGRKLSDLQERRKILDALLTKAPTLNGKRNPSKNPGPVLVAR